MGIIVSEFKGQFNKDTCVALGYFDSVHKGHATLIEACKKTQLVASVFTFSNSPYGLLGGVDENVFTYEERLDRLQKLGVELCISAKFDSVFMAMGATEFLNHLVKNFCVKQVVIGSDYTCGKNAEFNAVDAQRYLESLGVKCVILPLINVDEGKIATRLIKQYVKNGDIKAINNLLPIDYSIIGKVEHGRKEGSTILGYPTANISFHKDKMLLKEGVYYTKIAINGKIYKALSNVGSHPTFDDYNYNIESFILGFAGLIYDKQIEVVFVARLRDTVKFSCVQELVAQIQQDIRRVEQWQ